MTTATYEQLAPYSHLSGIKLLEALFRHFTPADVALLSAFNPEDVLLAAWLTDIAPATTIFFLNTHKHFPETLRYVDAISKQLKLQNIVILEPDNTLTQNIDATGDLWKTQVNRCCWLRKVKPLETALRAGKFQAAITGRRKEQTPERTDMQSIEQDDNGMFKFNPLLDWSKQQRDDEMKRLHLPHHPLYDLGYPSIGCAPCTTPVFPGEDERAGRWRHTRKNDGDQKTECGLHVSQ